MIKIAAAAAVAASIVFAPAAYADDDAYLDELSGQGFQVMWQSRPFLLAAGNGMCNDLRNGETPEQVASHSNYPNEFTCPVYMGLGWFSHRVYLCTISRAAFTSALLRSESTSPR